MYFSQTAIGANDIMVSNAALRYLGLNPNRKDDIEIYFSIAMVEDVLGSLQAAGTSKIAD
jgi:hypothetical protein